jgi:hypothetical protein
MQLRCPPAHPHVPRRYTDGIPGKLGLPLLNDDLLLALKPGRNVMADLSHERRKKYGDIYRNRYIGEVVVTVGGLDNVKRLLAAEHVLVEGACTPPLLVSILSARPVAVSLATALPLPPRCTPLLSPTRFTHSTHTPHPAIL